MTLLSATSYVATTAHTGQAPGVADGKLLGIARHARPRGPMDVIEAAAVTIAEGVHGDFRGAARPGSRRKRQVTLLSAEGWAAAMDDLGLDIAWQERRANLLVSGIKLPIEPGTLIRVGTALVEVTGECDPCSRMEEIAPGLRAALTPDWRGGVCTRVIEDGHIALGDTVRIEE